MTTRRRSGRGNPPTTRARALLCSFLLHAAGIGGALSAATHTSARVAWDGVVAPASAPELVPADAAELTPPVKLLPIAVEPETAPAELLSDAAIVTPAPGPDADDDEPEAALPLAILQRPPRPPQWLARVLTAKPPAAAVTPAPPQTGGYVEPSLRAGCNEPPPYPWQAWRRGLQGAVTVILELDAEGRVTAAHVETSSGCSQLDDAALQKLSTWRFEPARQDSVAMRSTFRQQVVFRLDG